MTYLMCESHMPAPPGSPSGCLTFHSTTTAPGAAKKYLSRNEMEKDVVHTWADRREDHI